MSVQKSLSDSGNNWDDPEEKRQRLRSSVLKEIFDSESKYLQDLYTLIIYYITPIKTNNRFPEISANPKGDVKMLFSTVELIFDGNSELLEKLKKEFTTKEPMVGATFLGMADKLCQYYGVFCNHQKEAMDTIDRCLKTSSTFKAFLEQCMQKPEVNNLSLMDYLVKPFQRLLKYPLLLRELQKLTLHEHPDYTNIQQAIDKLQIEVDKINKDKAKSDNMKKMLEINQCIEGFPRGFKLLLPSRIYVYEGTLRKISGKNDQERHIFLFNDCFVYCKKKSATEYVCRGVIYLHKLQLEDMADSCSFKVIRHDKNLTYVFYGNTRKEKDTWLHEIRSQQSKLQLSFNRPRNHVASAKDIVRIYLDSKKFKSFALNGTTTAADLANQCSKKIKREGLEATNIQYKVALIISGNQERLLDDDEKIQDVRDTYDDQGIKLEDPTNCLMLREPDGSPLSASAYDMGTLRSTLSSSNFDNLSTSR